jgi:hypothetical protein
MSSIENWNIHSPYLLTHMVCWVKHPLIHYPNCVFLGGSVQPNPPWEINGCSYFQELLLIHHKPPAKPIPEPDIFTPHITSNYCKIQNIVLPSATRSSKCLLHSRFSTKSLHSNHLNHARYMFDILYPTSLDSINNISQINTDLL